MDYQLEEVYTRTLTHTKRLGTALQSRTSHCFSSRLLLRFSHLYPIPSISVLGHACTQDNFYHQSDLSLCPIYPSQMPSSQVPAILDKETLVTIHTVLGHSDPTGYGISQPSTLVQLTRSSSRSPIASPGAHPVFLHWCVANRMGSQLADSSSLRTVVTSRVLPTYQLAGTRSNTTSCTSVGTSVAQPDCSSILWQQHGSSLHSQIGRDAFHLSVQQNAGTVSISEPVCDSHSNTSSRIPECDSRFTVSSQQPQSYRMDDSPGNLTQSVLCLRDPLEDMFATAENKMTPVYVSPYPYDRAWAVDALSISWDGLRLVYAFPPAPIVPKTLQKIKFSHGTTVILIASQHPSRTWHPLLLQLSLRPHIPLTDVALSQYIPTIHRPQFHRDPRLLDLAAWLLSGISSNSTTSLTQ